MNVCVFVGRVGKAPELQYLPSGSAIVRVGVALNEFRDGKQLTTWVDLTLFGESADNFKKLVGAGDVVSVTAKYTKNTVDSDGGKKTYHGFTVMTWERLVKSTGSAGSSFKADAAELNEDEFPF